MVAPSDASDLYKSQIRVIGEGTYNVQDPAYGAIGDGTDDTAAIAACVAAAPAGSTVVFPEPSLYYLVTSNIEITKPLYFEGLGGPMSVRIHFQPTAAQICFKWTLTQVPCGIKNFWFTSDDVLYQKTAIQFIDVSSFTLSDVHIGRGGATLSDWWHDKAGNSVGIIGYGREVISIGRIRIFADRPVVLGKNPNHSFLDVDQVHFYDTYLVVTTGVVRANIEILDNVHCLMLTINGQNAWAKGQWGLYWNTTTHNAISYGVFLSGIRVEQGLDSGNAGYFIYINHATYVVQQVVLDNLHMEPNDRTNGIYIKGFRELSMNDLGLSHIAGGVSLELDHLSTNRIKHVEWSNCVFGEFGGSYVFPNDLTLINAVEGYPDLYSLPVTATYRLAANLADDEKGVLVAPDLRKNYFARTLISPQDGVSDISFTTAPNTITSAGAVSFAGIKRGEIVYIQNTVSNNGIKTAAANGTTGSLLVNETLVAEANKSANIIHGIGLHSRADTTNIQKTEITIYAENEATLDRALYVMNISGKLGAGSQVVANKSSIFESNASITGIPVSNKFSYEAILDPARLWNNRTTPASEAHVIIEQLNW